MNKVGRRSGVCAFFVLAVALACVCSAAQATPLRVKVLVLTAIGPELHPWLAHMDHPTEYKTKAAYSATWCDTRHICVTQTGVGETNAAASAMAILADSRFNFDNAVVLRVGIAGGSIYLPQATLGSAIWSDWVVNWDLGHHLLPKAGNADQAIFLPMLGRRRSELACQVNPELLDVAYGATKSNTLVDDRQAQDNRQLYPEQANAKPVVAVNANVSADDFWAGRRLTHLAQRMVRDRTHGASRFATSAMEDWGDCMALRRQGMLSRYLSLRTVSDFTQPPAGHTSEEMILADTYPGGRIAIANAYSVAQTFVDYVLAHPGKIKSAVAGDPVQRPAFPMNISGPGKQ